MSMFSYMTGNAIYSAIQNSKTKKDIKRIIKETSDANYVNRAVTAMPYVNKRQLLLTPENENDIYICDTKSTTPALDFIWGTKATPESIVASGGSIEGRVKALMPFVRKTQMERMPVIAIHAGNPELEAMLSANSAIQEVISSEHAYYDVFRGMPVEDIAGILYETMPEETNPGAEALLRALADIIIRLYGKIGLKEMAAYTMITFMDDLDSLLNQGGLTTDEYRDLSRDYMSGTSEIDAVKSFLYRLNRQIENVFGKSSVDTSNIKRTLNQKGIVIFDIGKARNDLVMKLILNHLLYYQENGKEFALLLDGIKISEYEQLRLLVKNRIFAISENDFVASLFGGKTRGEDLFAEIMGDVATTVIFTHKSGLSCQKWSEQFGKYHKLKLKMSISQSSAFMSGVSDSRSIQIEEADEARIKAETIAMLPEALACIHNQSGILIAKI